jgi:thiamine-monophosphate kinase
VAVDPACDLVLAVDMMVESRHFDANTDPEALGHKILAVNLSDLAAMGARPRWALLAGALPDGDAHWLEAFSRGLFALADLYRVTLVGGDTTRGPRNLCLTIAGEVPAGQAVRRSGATAGDDVWVSGTLGDAMLGLAAPTPDPLSDPGFALATGQLDRPTPPVRQQLRGVASMIDVSDGLVGDLGHVLDASAVSATVELAHSVPAGLAEPWAAASVLALASPRWQRRLRALLHCVSRRRASTRSPPTSTFARGSGRSSHAAEGSRSLTSAAPIGVAERSITSCGGLSGG